MSMQPRAGDPAGALVQIDKVLQLEARQGYRDRAASGGIARFVGERVRALLAGAAPPAQRQLRDLDALVAGYDERDEPARERIVAEAVQLVRELLAMGATDPVAPPANPVTPFPRSSRAPASAPAVPSPRPPAPVTPIRPASAPAPAPAATPERRPRATVRARPAARIIALGDSVRLLPGVGEQRAKQLEQLGVRSVRDLLRLYPRHHIDYSNIQPIASLLFGHMTTIHGVVAGVEEQRTRTGKSLVDVVVEDATGRIHAIFFNPYVQRALRIGMPVSLSGRVEQLRGNLTLTNPEWEALEEETLSTGRLTPVYPLTKGLYQKTLRTLLRQTLDAALHLVQDHLPDELVAREGLIGLREAWEWIHFPDGATPEEARQRLHLAHRRLAFDEFFVLQIGLLQRKRGWQVQPGNAIPADPDAQARFVASLPWPLTGAQERALAEILRDMEQPQPMTRLLQGDVGSGKTVVAAIAALAAIRAGFQVALMAPTEILAEQHYRGLRQLFDAAPEDIRPSIGFLSGKVAGSERTAIYDGARGGALQLVVGTHALIQGGLEFDKLGLAIVDEQHRFGVEQRTALRSKGRNADILVMTATPIPRTLALTLHGDLDVATLDELPPGRQPIATHWIVDKQRQHAWRFVREEVQQGRQAFIVFPLVEESEQVDARAAVAEHERLQAEVFPDLRLGLLHGRMKPAEKDAVMVQFRDRVLDILVATSVVEVGIDVPNATVMVVDGAERFGLSQLHQFRGRVGRGSAKSTCILISGDATPEGRQRLQALVDSQDGFRLAQIDLELRGPGDFLGKRQSGLPALEFSSFADTRDLERARDAAERLLTDDPDLEQARHVLLRARLDAFWASAVTDVN